MFERLLNKFGFFKKSKLIEQLNFARSVNKRLDEHRETVEDLEKSGFFNDEYFWRASHMATQDDYLMRLFHIVHGFFPDDNKQSIYLDRNNGKMGHPFNVRPRPKVLGKCNLPEYNQGTLNNSSDSNERASFVAVNFKTKEEFYFDDTNRHKNYFNCVVFQREDYLKNKSLIWLDEFISSTTVEELEKLRERISNSYNKHHNIKVDVVNK